MVPRILTAALLSGVVALSTAHADPVCDDDLAPGIEGRQNACDCAAMPSIPPGGAQDCIALGDICVAGDLAALSGCVSLGGDSHACIGGLDPAGIMIPCSASECAAAANAGCR